ncbi:MAG: YqeG family HAD IIIA-type phosphatase [Candidatus Woesearchaeota archaeon]
MVKNIKLDKSFKNIDINLLKDLGIKGVIVDLDNTLFDYNSLKFRKGYSKKFKELKENFKVVILSNRINIKKDNHFHKTYDKLRVPIVRSNKPKPFFEGFNKALSKLDLKKDEVLIIGDRVGTDILGGYFFGINTLLVKPITKNEFFLIRFVRLIESFILYVFLKLKSQ